MNMIHVNKVSICANLIEGRCISWQGSHAQSLVTFGIDFLPFNCCKPFISPCIAPCLGNWRYQNFAVDHPSLIPLHPLSVLPSYLPDYTISTVSTSARSCRLLLSHHCTFPLHRLFVSLSSPPTSLASWTSLVTSLLPS